MKKIIIAFAIALLVVTVAGNASVLASQPEKPQGLETSSSEVQRLTLITSVTPSLSVSGSSASYILGVVCIPSVNSISATLQIQQWNGSAWINYGSSWSVSSNKSYLDTYGTKAVASGYTYRLKADITASNGTTVGTTTSYS